MNQHFALHPRSVAAALNGEAHGNKVAAPGPGHSPADRSMSILVDPNAPGGFVVHSFAGDDPLACKDFVNEKLGRPSWEPTKRADSSSRVVAEYVYRNADGQPHLRVTRTSTKQFYQSRWTGSAWETGTKGLTPLPYRLPELLASTGPVFVCEGEKDADRLASLGFTATTNAMGAGKWREALNKWFKGRTVFILPDNDEPGRSHAEDVARNLQGTAHEVRIVELPGLPLKGDMSDWLDADENGEDAYILLDVADAAPVWQPKPGANGKTSSPRISSAAALRRKQFPAIRYIVDGYIAEGCTLLAGRPKLGKSWLMLDVGIAVAAGRYCLGETKCEQGEVLYLALEDNERRLQSRIDKLLGTFGDEWPEGFQYATEWPRANDGGIEEIRRWIEAAKNPRLVVVDVLAMFRPTSGNRDNQYEADYHAIKGLQALASEFHIAIVIVHHTRKAGSDVDPFEKVSGTLGLSGAADTVIVLDRDGSGATLYGRGRDVEEVEVAVEFDKATCRWRILGQAADVRRTDERSKILSVLIEAEEPSTPAEIAVGSGMSRNNVDQLLFKMTKVGEVLKAGRGRYIHADRTDLIEAHPVSLHKKDKKIRNDERGEDVEEGDQEPFLSSYRSYRGVEAGQQVDDFPDIPPLRRTKGTDHAP